MKDKKELILNTLIEHKGLAYMIDLAEQIFHNPLFVYDMSVKILAKSSSEISSQVWDILLYGQKVSCFLADGYSNANAFIAEITRVNYERELARRELHPQPVRGFFDEAVSA